MITTSAQTTNGLTDAELRATPVDVADGGGSLTVDATNLDIRDLANATDSVTAHQGGTWTVTGSGGTFPVTDSGGSLTVDAPAGTPVFVRLSDGASAVDTIPVSFPSGVAVAGTDAHDAAVTGKPVLIGGYASAVAPTGVNADGDMVHLWADRTGRLYINADTEMPAAAALDDATSNPTAPMVGAGAMLWDPVAAKWRRQITYNRATAFSSQIRVAGTYDTSVIDAAGMRYLYIYATLSSPGGGTLTVAVNDSSGSFRLATAGTAISTTTPVLYAMGAGLTVPATGLTYVGQVWSIPVPGQFKIRAATTATSTFEVLYELVP